MRMEPLLFYGRVKVGTDRLKNDVFQETIIYTSEGRFSTWNEQEIALDKRNVTSSTRKIITRAKLFHIKSATAVRINNKLHDIKEIKGDDYTRWRVIIVDQFGRVVT